MTDILEQFKAVGQKALTDLKQISSLEQLEQFRIKYLSRKGEVTELLSQLGKLPKELKPQAGKLANQIKNEVKGAFDEFKASLEQQTKAPGGPLFDVTLPGKPVRLARAPLPTWRRPFC